MSHLSHCSVSNLNFDEESGFGQIWKYNYTFTYIYTYVYKHILLVLKFCYKTLANKRPHVNFPYHTLSCTNENFDTVSEVWSENINLFIYIITIYKTHSFGLYLTNSYLVHTVVLKYQLLSLYYNFLSLVQF